MSGSLKIYGHRGTHLQGLDLGKLKAISDDPGVQSLGDVSVGLLQQLAHQHHHRGGSVAANVVLRSRCSGNHDGGRVLYLHLSQEDVAVLGQLDLAGNRQ